MDYFSKTIDKNYLEIHQMKEKLWAQHLTIDSLRSMISDQSSIIANFERQLTEIKGIVNQGQTRVTLKHLLFSIYWKISSHSFRNKSLLYFQRQ